MGLTQIVYVLLIVAAAMILAFWVYYTRHLRTRPHVGKQEGIAMAIQERERKHGSQL